MTNPDKFYQNLLPTWQNKLCNGETPLSVHMIVKNEENVLARCLRSLIQLSPREVVIADTGSSDATKEIAHWFGCKVIDLPWNDHFSEARNAVLEHCTSEWIMWIDADEEIEETGAATIKKRILDKEMKEDFHAVRFVEGPSTMMQCRIWKNRKEVQWIGRVHEKVRIDTGLQRHVDVAIIQHSDERRPEKQRRNLRLINIDIENNGESAGYNQHFYASILHNQLQEYNDSIRHAESFLVKSPVEDLRPRVYMHYLLAYTDLFIKKDIQSCVNRLASLLAVVPFAAELWCLMADAYWHAKRLPDALVLYENALCFGSQEDIGQVLWIVDKNKYDEYPREKIKFLKENLGITRPFAISPTVGAMTPGSYLQSFPS